MAKHDNKSSSSTSKTPEPNKGPANSDAAKIAAEEKAAQLAAEDAAKRADEERAAKIAADEEAAKRAAEEQAARVAEEEAAERAAQEAKERIAKRAARDMDQQRRNASHAGEMPSRVSYHGKTLTAEIQQAAAAIISERGIDAYSGKPAGEVKADEVFAVTELPLKRQLVVVTIAGRKLKVELT